MDTAVWEPTPTLVTERLRLRPYSDDAEDRAFFQGLFSDPTVMTHLDGALDAGSASGVFDRVLDLTRRRAFWLWGIESRETGSLVGHAEVKPNDEIDAVEVVYMLEAASWGRGLATEDAHELVGVAADQVARPVAATVQPANAASRAVLRRVGLWYDGERTSDGLEVHRLPAGQDM